jgi:3-oxoacyl-[acyl-carrier protein] reductase
MDTDRLRANRRHNAEASGEAPEAIAARQAREVPAGRFGSAEEFGQVCAFLCSMHAGYITGQNILVDGGLFPGTF